MPQCFAQLSDPHLSSLSEVRPRDLLNKRALSYLSWRQKRRFEHRPEVLAALLNGLLLGGVSVGIAIESFARLADPGGVAAGPMMAIAAVHIWFAFTYSM